MNEQDRTRKQRTISRRELLGGAAAVAALAALPGGALRSAVGQTPAKPDSMFNGVQIGAITYSFRGLPGTAEDILKYVLQCGISSIELMGEPVEQFAGVPAGPRGGGRRGQMTEEQRQAMQKSREE